MNFIIARLLNVGIVLLLGLQWLGLPKDFNPNQDFPTLTEMKQQYLSDWIALFDVIPVIKNCVEDAQLSMEAYWGKCAHEEMGASDLRNIVEQCAQSQKAMKGKLSQSRTLALFAVAYLMSVDQQNDYEQFAMKSGMDVASIDRVGQHMLEFKPEQSNSSTPPCAYLFQSAVAIAGQNLIHLKDTEEGSKKVFIAAWEVVKGSEAQFDCLCQKYDQVPPPCSCP